MLLLLLFACKGDTTVDSAVDSAAATDTAPVGEDVPVELLEADVRCEAGVSASLRSAGWLGGATLTLYGPSTESGWLVEEAHPFPTLPEDYDPLGAWDAYSLNLIASAEYAAGVSTALDCTLPWSWQIEVRDSAGAVADCVAGGDEADSLGCRAL